MEQTQIQSRSSPAELSQDGALAAAQIRLLLAKSGTLVVALIGPPGAGKTALLEATARQLRGVTGLAIIVANPAAERDAARIERYCQQVQAVNASAPNAEGIHAALQHMQLKGIGIVFIESLGGIAESARFRAGRDRHGSGSHRRRRQGRGVREPVVKLQRTRPHQGRTSAACRVRQRSASPGCSPNQS